MRVHGKVKLGFFPLPTREAERLRHHINLTVPSQFSALDPCVGDGVAFTHLLHGVTAHPYGIEIDASRAEQARALGIETLQADTMDVRCPSEAVSLLYLNEEICCAGRRIFLKTYPATAAFGVQWKFGHD